MNTEENKALEAEAECCESFQVHSDMVDGRAVSYAGR